MKRLTVAVLLALGLAVAAHAQTYSLAGKSEAQFSISACGSVYDATLVIYSAEDHSVLDVVDGYYSYGHAIFDVSADASAFGDTPVTFSASVDSDCGSNESTVAILD